MVLALIGLVAAAVVVLGLIFFREPIAETGFLLGGSAAALGTGIQTGLGAVLSPEIRPTFVPTIGLRLELPGGFGTLDGGGRSRDDGKNMREFFPGQNGFDPFGSVPEAFLDQLRMSLGLG